MTGKGTRDWAPAEKEQLLKDGFVDGYTGHHINGVRTHPVWQGDPRNIRFLPNSPRGGDHLHGGQGHRGHFRNNTRGRLIDRQAMIDQRMEVVAAALDLKAQLARYLPLAATPGEPGPGSSLAGESLLDYLTLVATSHITIPWTFELLEMYASSEIDPGQIGYRWFAKANGEEGEALPDWPTNWIVLGQRSGDPVIFDEETGAVMLADHGMGEWSPRVVAPNIADFLRLLAVWIRVAIGEFQKEFRDDRMFYLLPSFTLRLRENLEFLSNEHLENFMSSLD